MFPTDTGSIKTADFFEFPELNHQGLVRRVILPLLLVAMGLGAWGILNAQVAAEPYLPNPIIVHRAEIVAPELMAAQVNPKFQRLSAYVADRFEVEPEEALEIVSAVYRNAEQVGVSPHLVLGIIAVESGFNSDAAYLGAKGLMQIIPVYHQPLMREINHDLFDAERNIYAGTRIFAKFLASSPSQQVALLRYNGSAKDPAQTYSRKVFAEARKFEVVEQQLLGANIEQTGSYGS